MARTRLDGVAKKQLVGKTVTKKNRLPIAQKVPRTQIVKQTNVPIVSSNVLHDSSTVSYTTQFNNPDSPTIPATPLSPITPSSASESTVQHATPSETGAQQDDSIVVNSSATSSAASEINRKMREKLFFVAKSMVNRIFPDEPKLGRKEFMEKYMSKMTDDFVINFNTDKFLMLLNEKTKVFSLVPKAASLDPRLLKEQLNRPENDENIDPEDICYKLRKDNPITDVRMKNRKRQYCCHFVGFEEP